MNNNILIGIYFANQPEMNLIKIGASNNIISRLRILQGENASRIFCIGYILTDDHIKFKIERDIHAKLCEYQYHGEWFNYFDMNILKDNYEITTDKCDIINTYISNIFKNNRTYVDEYKELKERYNNIKLIENTKLENNIYNYLRQFGYSSVTDICNNLNIESIICKRIIKDMLSKDMISCNNEHRSDKRLYINV